MKTAIRRPQEVQGRTRMIALHPYQASLGQPSISHPLFLPTRPASTSRLSETTLAPYSIGNTQSTVISHVKHCLQQSISVRLQNLKRVILMMNNIDLGPTSTITCLRRLRGTFSALSVESRTSTGRLPASSHYIEREK